MRPGKRFFDLVVSMVGLLMLAPLFAAIALVIKLGGRGPVFFRQERIGYQGRPFAIWKFRTMVPGAEKFGGQLTLDRDRRITGVGRLLRLVKLDELPQLINVLKGEMSFVGPRPEVKRYVDFYTAEQKMVLQLVPGITDPASLKYRHESELLAHASDADQKYREEIMPDKISINLNYAKRANIFTDIAVVINTIFRAVPRKTRPGRGGEVAKDIKR